MSVALPIRHTSLPQDKGAFPVLLYLVFSCADLLFSLVAFAHGVAEGNPFMAWLLRAGIFVPGKIVISLAVALVMAMVYNHSKRGRVVTWGGITVMGAVVAYHLMMMPRIIAG